MTSTPRLRLFIAAPVPGPLLARLERATQPLRARWPSARWAPAANQHVTLKFLGSVEETLLEPVSAVVSRVAGDHAASTLRLDGLGVFPSPARARVLWVGLDDPADLLASLARDLEEGLEPLGFAPERRAFRAHLTLARFKQPVRAEDLGAIDLGADPDFEVDRVELFRSHLNPKGARYEVLRSHPLEGGIA